MKKAKTLTAMASVPPKKHRWLRRILIALAVLVGLFVLGTVAVLAFVWQRSLVDTVGKVSFDNQLPIPQLADSVITPDGTRTFNLTLQTGQASFFDDAKTDRWGINQSYLGPTLRAKRGEKVQINVKNTLAETSTIHWHGMHLPAQMDGSPHQPIKPEATWSPHWTISQPAATLWYHPHPHGQTEKHMYKGLAGMFILDDDSETANELPHAYGEDDIPIIIQDKKFKKDRQLDDGNTGNEIVVNGARTPHVKVSTELVRLRLLNASTARVYNFGLSNDQPMQLIASDGGLLEQPVVMKRVLLSPGERAEVVVAMQPSKIVTLRSYPTTIGANFYTNRTLGGDDSLDIMQLRAGASLAPSPGLPQQLASIERLDKTAATTTRQFKLSGFAINDKFMDMNRIDATIKRGDTEIWEVTNIDSLVHNFHVHDVQFQVLSIDGSPPPPELGGGKDTILVKPGQKVRLIMQFTDFSDTKYPYMFHCHLLNHEDQGMMGQFVVVEPGQRPVERIDGGDHGH